MPIRLNDYEKMFLKRGTKTRSDIKADRENAKLQEEKDKKNKYQCFCECHSNSSMMHFMPCCILCEKCGINVQASKLKEHEALCSEK